MSQLKPEWPTIRQLIRLAIPGGVDGAARSFSAVAMVAIVTRFGPVATAAYGIGVRVMSLVWSVSGAIGQGVATGVGQNLGANKLARTNRVAWVGVLCAFVAVGLAGVLAVVFAPAIIHVFVPSADVIAEGSRFLRISGWGFGFAGALMVIQGAFQGAGRTGYSMTLSLLNRWLLRMPVAIFLAWVLAWGATGIWWSFIIADAIGFGIGAAWMQWGKWHQNLLAEAPEPRPAAQPAARQLQVAPSGVTARRPRSEP